MYYRLDTEFGFPACEMSDDDNVHETLMSGIVVDESSLVLPWPFGMSCDNDPDMRLGDYYSSCNLMSARLVGLLQSAGVDNLQIFPALITHTCTGKTIDTYKVVNVLGLVSAADFGASKAHALAGSHYFEELAVKKSKTRDLLMFRLEESPIEILVHERVARQISDGGFVDVSLEPVASE